MKRMIAIILAALLLLAALPMAALADDPEPQPATPELTVSGAGTFVYDGAAHAVTGTVQNAGADTYRISYSVNGTNVRLRRRSARMPSSSSRRTRPTRKRSRCPRASR